MKEENVNILHLPQYQCELNPIELVWSQMKRRVAKNNDTLKDRNTEKIINDGITAFSTSQWKNYCEKSDKRRIKCDKLMICKPLIVQLTGSGSSSTNSTSSGVMSDVELLY